MYSSQGWKKFEFKNCLVHELGFEMATHHAEFELELE